MKDSCDSEVAVGVPDDLEGAAERIGRRRFLRCVGVAAGVGVMAGGFPEGLADAADLPAGASSFAALPKAVRIADTRNPSQAPFTRVSRQQIRVRVAGRNGVPAGATAVVLTVTGVNPSEQNYVTVFPAGTAPLTVSNLNLAPGDVNANLVTVKTGAGGSIDVFSRVPCEVVVDVLGYYAPVTAAVRGGRFEGLPVARRVLDTRPGRARSHTYTLVDLSSVLPTNASAVAINLTAADTTGRGFFSALPTTFSGKVTTSTLNVSGAGQARAAGAIVPVDSVRRIKIYTLTSAALIIDVVGFFTGPTSELSRVGLFVPLTPKRVLDTRAPGQIGRLWPSWVVEAKLPEPAASNASAIVANLTGVDARARGYLTISPARLPIPGTSNLNMMAAGAIVPNHVITPTTTSHGVQVFSARGCHVLIDLAGYYTGTPKIPKVAKYVNPAPPPVPPRWVLRVPRIGLTSTVLAGDPNWVTDRGYSWHWTGTGYMGQHAHVSLFGHRTEAGGPYRYLHHLRSGDLFTVTTLDDQYGNREYTYRMVRRDLTNSDNTNILNATRLHPGTTLSLIACTVGYDSSKSAYPDAWAPTSLKYRIIVTGELVSWREV